MQGLPTGTVTFLFTDIEGSTRLLQQLGDSYADVLDHHRTIVRDIVARLGGQEFGTEGDAFFLVFSSASAAVAAAAEIQRSLAKSPADGGGSVRVRMGVHTGEGRVRDGDYVGIDLHRVARIAAAGHGGQVLLSESIAALARGQLPEGTAVRDLGSYSLKDLREPEHLYQLDIEGLRTDFPSVRSAGAEVGNLPRQLTSFVGRQRELERCRQLLRETRLLTLTGPGGTGKTRLALQIADTTRDDFSAGAWFVALASIRDPELVPSTIAETLGLMETQGSRPPLELVIDHLQNKDALLVLDNFEQIVPAGPIVTDLLNATTGVKVIVTSRAPLRLYGEHEFPVPPLGLPDPRHLPDLATLSHYEAVALFIDRARGVRPDFAVTNENAPAVAEICARLDGLPLAIELAAARIRIFPPQTMLARLGDRLALLAGGSRDLPARQQTLRQAIAWSHDLLSPAEQRLFGRFSVFRGGAQLEEAESVGGRAEELEMEILVGLDSLTEKSLLTVDEGPGEPRFRMLETINEFAKEQLTKSGEEDELRRRHADVFLSLAERAEPNLLGREGKRWLDRLEPDHDNFRAALDWACSRGETEIALRMGGALWRFWLIRGHLPEARMRIERALALAGVRDHPRAWVKALEAAGGIAYWQFDLEGQSRFYEQALAVSEEIGDKGLIANALYNIGFPFIQRKQISEARTYMERSLALYEEIGDVAGVARAHWGLGDADYTEEKYDDARYHIGLSLSGARKVGDEFLVGWSLFTLGITEMRSGNLPTAREGLREALMMFSGVGDVTGTLFCFESLGEIEVREGRPERGLRLKAAAAALRGSSGTELRELGDQEEREEDRGGLSEEEAARTRSEGKAMTLEEAIAYALE
jgi:predicted ATPase/class 3 adenylate cyclase